MLGGAKMASVSVKRPFNPFIGMNNSAMIGGDQAAVLTPQPTPNPMPGPDPAAAAGPRNPAPMGMPVLPPGFMGSGVTPMGQLANGDAGLAGASAFLQTDGTTAEAIGNMLAAAGNVRAAQGKESQQANNDNATAAYFDKQGRHDLATMARAGLAKEAFLLLGKEKEADAEGSHFGLNPVWAQGADGEYALFQPDRSGSNPKRMQFPDGFSPVPSAMKIDAGTHTELRDKFGNPVAGGSIDKNVVETNRQKKTGTDQGAALAQLQPAIVAANYALGEITEFKVHPGISEITGRLNQMKPNWLMGAQGRDAMTRYNQLRGTAFLQAYNMLRGGGQITEVEGAKAEAAITRMDRMLDEEDFKSALDDFVEAVKVGIQKLSAAAGEEDQSGQLNMPPPGNVWRAPNGVTIEQVE